MHTPRERRWLIVNIPERLMLDVFFHWQHCKFLTLPGAPFAPDLPGDCEVVDVAHDRWSRVFQIRLYHPSFTVVPDGAPTPIHETVGKLQFVPIRFDPSHPGGPCAVAQAKEDDVRAEWTIVGTQEDAHA